MDKIFPPYIAQTYKRLNVNFVRGEGPYLFDGNGEKYLDFVSGIAVTNLGHGHPYLSQKLKEQVETLLHVSNLYCIDEQERLAQRLCENSFAEAVFFCNSGAEAAEGAIKFARRTHFSEEKPHKNKIITFKNAFHGRTMGALSATGNKAYMEGFTPLVDGFTQIPLNDVTELERVMDENVAALMFEPMQAEGGLHPLTDKFIQAIKEQAALHDALIIIDEVQTGMGRTGTLFAYEQIGITPDIMMLAKGLGGGVPVGAVAVNKRVAQHLKPGMHGSTFGGNPLAMAAGNAVLDVLMEDGFLQQVSKVAQYAAQQAEKIILEFPALFEEVRQMGLLFGLKCKQSNADIVDNAFLHGLLLHVAGDNALRFLPPLVINNSHIDEAFNKLRSAIGSPRQH